jgi:hypothetical protein
MANVPFPLGIRTVLVPQQSSANSHNTTMYFLKKTHSLLNLRHWRKLSLHKQISVRSHVTTDGRSVSMSRYRALRSLSVRVTLRLTVSMSWCRAHFVDVWPDIASFSRVWVWNLLSCLWPPLLRHSHHGENTVHPFIVAWLAGIA